MPQFIGFLTAHDTAVCIECEPCQGQRYVIEPEDRRYAQLRCSSCGRPLDLVSQLTPPDKLRHLNRVDREHVEAMVRMGVCQRANLALEEATALEARGLKPVFFRSGDSVAVTVDIPRRGGGCMC